MLWYDSHTCIYIKIFFSRFTFVSFFLHKNRGLWEEQGGIGKEENHCQKGEKAWKIIHVLSYQIGCYIDRSACGVLFSYILFMYF